MLKILLVFIIILLIISALIFFLFKGFENAIKNFVAPNDPEQSIKIVKWTLGFDFGSEHEIIKHDSWNYWNGDFPNRPFKISLKLSDKSSREVLSFILKQYIAGKEDISTNFEFQDGWYKSKDGFSKSKSESKFSPLLVFYPDRHIIHYDDTMC